MVNRYLGALALVALLCLFSVDGSDSTASKRENTNSLEAEATDLAGPERDPVIEALLEDFNVSDCSTGISADGCYRLTGTHTGKGERPVPILPCDPGFCEEGRYGRGRVVQVKAQAGPQWEVGSWEGTNDNRSPFRTNIVMMPGRDFAVMVNYVQGSDRLSFVSSFEQFGFGDWWGEFYKDRSSSSGTVFAGQSVFPAAASYVSSQPAWHRGLVIGSEGSDLDLFLWWWDGTEWLLVASETSPLPEEYVEHEGAPGRYRWEVRSIGEAASFELWTARGQHTAFPPNRLELTDKQRTDGKLALKSIYEAGSRGVFYVIDPTPGFGGGEPRYSFRFKIRVASGLEIQGKRHQIMQVRQQAGQKRVILEVFLRQVKEDDDLYALVLRAHENGKKGPSSDLIEFGPDRWTKIRAEWEAASAPGADDGAVRLFDKFRENATPVWQASLDNAGDTVDIVHFGQVTKGNKRTDGVVYFDEFKSSWDN